MGNEKQCTARWGRKSGEGKALLETNEILFRGAFRLKIPVKDISAIEARGGKLHVTFPEGQASFDLGQDVAEKWRHKILNPKSLMDKLGVKPGSRANLESVADAGFLAELRRRGPVMSDNDCDIVFFGAETDAVLKKLSALQKRIHSNGAIWVI